MKCWTWAATAMVLIAGLCVTGESSGRREVGAVAPFHRGVNLTSWFQAPGAGQIQFTRFTKKDFEDIKSLGCDVVRLPINLHFMTDGPPDYTLDPLFLHFLDQVVDWCEELEIHLILDNHTFDVDSSTREDIDEVLVPIWSQMAEHHKDRSEYLYYEILNEPHGISDARWVEIQSKVIEAIRLVDRTHTIVVTGAGWGSYRNLEHLPASRDRNLIYSFHFYDPFMFTHQGAGWVTPSMEPLAGVPFPYDPERMAACPPELQGTWIDSSLSNYHVDGTYERVLQSLDIAAAFQQERDVPIFCGEFGVYMRNSAPEDRVRWYEFVRTALEARGIPWTMWDYRGGFGLFERGTSELFEHDLNLPLVEALGLNPPEQTPMSVTPDEEGFALYTDYVAPGVFHGGWTSQGIVDYYWDAEPAEGEYCLYCTGIDRYNSVGFNFRPDRDLSLLVQGGAALTLWVRGDTPAARFDVRFLDTKTDAPDDHPWRMRATVSESTTSWDGQWHFVSIPLQSLVEHGSWDAGTWFNPRGEFDWTAVDRFEIVAEHSDFVGMQFWFDEVRITDPTRP